MELLGVALGTATVKAILRFWTVGTAIEGAEGDIVEAFGSQLRNIREKRALDRQLDSLADQVAERLEPFLSGEFGGIDEGEVTAAADAAQRSLTSVEAMHPSTLMDLDMNAADLTKLVRQGGKRALRNAYLSEKGEILYDMLITECSRSIISVAQQLPGYASIHAAEMLGRSSKIVDLATQTLDRLPLAIVPREWGHGSENDRFETKYKIAVAEHCDQLQLYGVTASTARKLYPISIAYISLSIAVESIKRPIRQPKSTDSNEEWPEVPEHFKAVSSPRIETLLEGSDCLFLTGGAGSGKTTLVQWLALSAIRSDENDRYVESWSGRVPFIIPLRRYVKSKFPQPEDFISTIAPNLTGAMPHGWTHRILSEGRGMLLIDGLDEVPNERRDEAREWVLALIRSFPSNKVLVTSRSSVDTRAWKNSGNFQEATLQPMDFSDIRAFIEHWHQAAAEAGGRTTAEDVLSTGKSLLATVRDVPAIRSLCTSPLLCALICALHLDGGSNIPNNRMDLYKTALEMLVLRRDNERSIEHIREEDLGYRERILLLRSFAFWLHDNGASDAERLIYEKKIAHYLKILHRVTADPNSVADYLVERSGVLREPIPGRIDFVHRTFQEYLAAAAIVDDDSIEKLIREAHEDHWREVIIMAAGHANRVQRAALLNGLIERGHNEQHHRPRLFMLAAACMETSPDLESALVNRLQHSLSSVLPPRNMTEAAAVASAGSLAVNLLRSEKQKAVVSAACVRALGLIGGEDALNALATYGKDSRVTVTRQLIRAWPNFDTEKYARLVLSESPLDKGRLIIRDVEQIPHIYALKHARDIYIDLPGGLPNDTTIPPNHPGIYGLDASRTPWIGSLFDLPEMPSLRSLTLQSSSLRDLEGIERYQALSYLSLYQSRSLRDISRISSLPHLRLLDVSASPVTSLNVFSEEHELFSLRVNGASDLSVIDHPIPAKSLVLTYAPQLRDLSGLSDSNQLERLYLGLTNGAVNNLQLPSSLIRLTLTNRTAWHMAEITGASNLSDLSFNGPAGEGMLTWIESNESLRSVRWGIYDASEDDISIENTIERIFKGPLVTDLTVWGQQEMPRVTGLEFSSRGGATIYKRSL